MRKRKTKVKFVYIDPRPKLVKKSKWLYEILRDSDGPHEVSYIAGVMRRLAANEIRKSQKALGQKQWRNPKWKR